MKNFYINTSLILFCFFCSTISATDEEEFFLKRHLDLSGRGLTEFPDNLESNIRIKKIETLLLRDNKFDCGLLKITERAFRKFPNLLLIDLQKNTFPEQQIIDFIKAHLFHSIYFNLLENKCFFITDSDRFLIDYFKVSPSADREIMINAHDITPDCFLSFLREPKRAPAHVTFVVEENFVESKLDLLFEVLIRANSHEEEIDSIIKIVGAKKEAPDDFMWKVHLRARDFFDFESTDDEISSVSTGSAAHSNEEEQNFFHALTESWSSEDSMQPNIGLEHEENTSQKIAREDREKYNEQHDLLSQKVKDRIMEMFTNYECLLE